MSLVDMEKIVIGICTYNRNELLNICLDKISVMKIPDNVSIEVVVVDNSAESIAADVVKSKTLNIHYFSFHGKGIASVRNEVLRQAVKLKPDYIAFIDDDEYPDENWIFELYTRLIATKSDVVTGPVVYNFVDTNFNQLKVPFWIKKNAYFKGKYKRPDGHICRTASTNNVLFKVSILDKLAYWFDEKYQMMTGEDIEFFERVYNLHYTILWVKKAVVNEIVSPERCTLKYIWKRNFNNGYLRIFNKRKFNRLELRHYYETVLGFLFFLCIFPFSIICGLTKLSNMYGKTAFSFGALVSLFKSQTLVHYKD